ncbi:hypothetical protein JWJ90_22505 [Desulfobulbus rhabdoformis]|uniref:hypothetical protein n=1 Tax=Desulfobulbus rhabdoformis TaxID=34032 RepID=UPI00196495A7|nr:hypothetical protein [Desulfobulbus rhabdoformis]MBM9617032.1 hypothetical protein [Desulfobulbus rhabdoformis]
MDNLAEYISGAIGLSVGGVLGFLCRAIVEHRLAIDRIKENIRLTEFNKSASEFRCSFTDEIRIVEESTIETDFSDIFNKGYVRHYNAIIRFQAYLSERDRAEIKKAWDNHCYPQGLDGYERHLPSAKFLHYDHSQGIEVVDGKPRISEEHEKSFRRAKNLVMKNLDSILTFAKFK